MAKKKAARIDQELVRALSHPIRVHILEELQSRVASPTELSKETGQSLGVISYHANTLVSCGCLELVRTRQRRGAVEHFFRAKPRSFIGHQDWRCAPGSVLGDVTGAAVGSFFEKAAAAAAAGTIDRRDDTTLSWMPITVDETGWRELAKIMGQAVELVTGVHERSAERLGSADGIPVIVGLAGFEAAAPRRAGAG